MSLQNLPPCVVTTASCDVLKDEGLELVEELKAARVPVIHHMVRGSHSFSHIADHTKVSEIVRDFSSLAWPGAKL